MIAASLREGDDVVDVLLSKEADVNAKSRVFHYDYISQKSFRKQRGAEFSC